MLYILELGDKDNRLGSSNPKGKANYYLGYCEDRRLNERLAEHKAGRGAAITRACVERNLEIKLIAILPKAGRKDERRWKNRKQSHLKTALIWGLLERA